MDIIFNIRCIIEIICISENHVVKYSFISFLELENRSEFFDRKPGVNYNLMKSIRIHSESHPAPKIGITQLHFLFFNFYLC